MTYHRTNEAAVHAWAQDLPQAWGHNPKRSIYYRDRTIYSYGSHFPMAAFVSAPNPEFGSVALVNSRSASITTSAHQGRVSQAIPHHVPRFTIPLPSGFSSRDLEREETAAEFHGEAWEAYVSAVVRWIGKAKRARVHGDEYMDRAAETAREGNRYADAFLLPWRIEVPSWETADGISDAQRAAANERRARNGMRRRPRRVSVRSLARSLDLDPDAETWETFADVVEFARVRDASAVQAWRDGGGDRFPVSYTLDRRTGERGEWNYARIRVEDSGAMIETDAGASVEIEGNEEAIRAALNLSRRAAETGTAYRVDGSSYRFGIFSLREIAENGSAVVGCHRFSRGEIRRLERALSPYLCRETADAE